MLYRINRLQTLLELITNETASAVGLLATQQTQMRTAIYQNRLTLGYPLARRWGIPQV
ncbi:ENR1 protein, partial [Jacana jacana]|nr:ENR1 protein [Jacana jacana]